MRRTTPYPRVARYRSPFTIIAMAICAVVASRLAAQNPIQAAKDALNKAKQQQQPQGQSQPNQPQTSQAASKPGAKPGQQAPANTDSGPFTAPAGTKIEPTVVAPVEQGSQFAVSSHGVHVATLSHSGSRAVMVYDGVPGPKFDQIFGQVMGAVGVAFSPDGSRYGYCGKVGNEFVVMVDGKEIARSSETDQMGIINMNSCLIGFTPGSKHVYYTSVVRTDPSHVATRFVYDGKVGPIGASNDPREYSFSPDDNHFTYPWSDPANGRNQKFFLDGNPAPYFGSGPQWTADSQHLFTKLTIAGKPGIDVLQDGKPVMHADALKLYLPPVGNMGVAAITRTTGGPSTQFLVIGGKVVPGSEIQGAISDVVISPDGKHYAARYKMVNQREYIFWDGKKGLDYQRVDAMGSPGVTPRPIAFTADSSKVVYVGFNDPTQFLVVGDQEIELPLHADETVVSPVGNRVASSGQGLVTLDGKQIKIPNVDPHTSRASALKFSPDGTRFAFALQDRGGISVFVDGVAMAGYGAIQANSVTFLWSPDSKHLAYLCRQPNGDVGVCIDGKYIRIGIQSFYGNLTWSPDSNHLYFIRKTSGYGYRVFADAKPVFDVDATSPGGFTNETFQTDASGSLLVLGQDETTFKRFRITPSPESSVAAMLDAKQ